MPKRRKKGQQMRCGCWLVEGDARCGACQRCIEHCLPKCARRTWKSFGEFKSQMRESMAKLTAMFAKLEDELGVEEKDEATLELERRIKQQHERIKRRK